MRITKTITVAGPSQSVWEVLADFGAISRWAPNVDHSCLMSDQRSGVGTTRRIQTGRNTVVERVVAWEDGERLSYSLHGLPPLIQAATNTWELNEQFTITTVSLTSDIETGPRPPQQLAARGVARVLGQASDQMLQGLQQQVQQLPAVSA